jgi:hypothetical protein
MSDATYNVQRNTAGKLMLMLSGSRKKYPGMPDANTEVEAQVNGEDWRLKVAKIAINKAWPEDTPHTNKLHEALAVMFSLPAVDKERVIMPKGCKVTLQRHGKGWVLKKK